MIGDPAFFRDLGRAQLARATESARAGPPHGLADHIVLCGFGRVGSAVAEALETFEVACRLPPQKASWQALRPSPTLLP